MIRVASTAFALLLSIPAAAPAASVVRPVDPAGIDRAARDVLAATGVPSASVAVVEDGKLVFARAYGEQAPGVNAVPQARYPIASISKQITATLLLKLQDQGKLSLDDKVAKYEPGLTGADTVTIRQLLNHTSGYRDFWPQDFSFAAMAHPVTPRAIMDRWAKAPLDFAPGSQWQYSNTGYVIAGAIVEKASGEPFLTYLHQTVLDPLKMTSAVDADTGMTAADPRPHMRYALGPVREEQPAAAGWLFAAGELAMNASDLARWDMGMIDQSLLSRSAYAQQRDPVVLTGGKKTDYGLGIEVDEVAGHQRLHHGGEAVGFLSENRVYPQDRAAIVVLVSADFADAQTAIADRIEAMMIPQPDATTRARAIFDGLREGRIDRARFTVNGNYYFTATALADYRDSLSKLGAPTSFVQAKPPVMRGGFTSESYKVSYPGRTLRVVVRAEPGEGGRIEQFTVYPAS